MSLKFLQNRPFFMRFAAMLACGALSGIIGFLTLSGPIRYFLGIDTTHLSAAATAAAAIIGACVPYFFFMRASEDNDARYEALLRYDTSTGLLTRRGFEDELLAFLVRKNSEKNPMMHTYLIAFEFDTIKDINETYGHEVGDTVIGVLGGRLDRMVGGLGPVGRVSGGEYVVALEATSNDRELKAVVDALIEALSRPIKMGPLSITTFGNAGVVRLNNTGVNLEAALRRSTLARAAARNAGRGTWAIYHPEMSQLAAYKKWIELELSSAIQRSELTLCYQAQVNATTGRVVGYEALLRWIHHDKGAIAPSEFIPIAENCGLIRQIGTWVLRKACEDALRLPDDITISVNVSTVQVMDSEFISTLRRTLDETGIDPRRLELEVTESIVITDFSVVRQRFSDIRALGCAIAIDDFGTGYSNLTNLAELPFQKLKIDKSFVERMESQSNIGSIVATIANLARSLNATVVAEGVETAQQTAVLKAAGCQVMQGYYYSRPLSLKDILLAGLNIGCTDDIAITPPIVVAKPRTDEAGSLLSSIRDLADKPRVA